MVGILPLFPMWESLHPFYAYFSGLFKTREKHAFRNLIVGATNGLMVSLMFVGLYLAASLWADEALNN